MLAIRLSRVAKATFASLATPLAGALAMARRLAGRAPRTSFEQPLRRLAPDEREVFAAFLERDSRTAAFVVTGDGASLATTANRLAARGYLSEVGRRTNAAYTEVCYAIGEPVFAFFKRHPELLRGTSRGEPTG